MDDVKTDDSNKRCKFFIKRPIRNLALKRKDDDKRSSDESSSDNEQSSVIRNEKRFKRNLNIQSTKSFKRVAGIREQETSSDDSEDENESISLSYRSKRKAEPEGPLDMGATKTIEIDTEKDKDAQAIFERSQKINEELKDKEDDKLYRGLNNYAQYVKKKDTAMGNASSGLVRQGPVRAPENIRSTVRWDYKPDLCKDYKETGFCGFGDSCIFLHDRSDYKSGWQIEMELTKGTYGDEDQQDYEIKEERIPFKCLLCRKSFKNPIVTRCKHYFCEKCALDHYRKTTRCFICGHQTSGIFNPAKEIIKKLDAKKSKHECDSSDEEHEHKNSDEEEEDDNDEDVDENQDQEENETSNNPEDNSEDKEIKENDD